MSREKIASPAKPSLFLPPPELRLHHPKRDGLIPTPLDNRGLVDTSELIHTIKSTVEPGYDWPSPFNDNHHLQWPSNLYSSTPDSQLDPQEFRNLAISQIRVPRTFHNWVHRITEPPPMPSEEVMRYRIESQRVALSLFQAIRVSKNLTRKEIIPEEALEKALIKRFDDFTTSLERARSLPEEFQLIDLSDYEPRDYEDMFALGARLGKLASAACVRRQVTGPAVA